ncbi:MAG TPA: radical SAM protein [Verrucomicrobiae bacterium]|nr:radical SAM protein [Verrucomicrobiae bacterium]
MRWVLIRPCNHSPYYDPEVQEPLGLEYLSAFARRQGHQVLVLDAVLDGHSDVRLARRSVAFQPDAIGISMTTAQEVDSVLAICREVARVSPGRNYRWIAGGNFITSEPLQAERLLPQEFSLVRFEGENALMEPVLLRSAADDRPSDQDLAIRSNPPKILAAKPIANLGDLPFPDRPYAEQIVASDGALNLQGSRGCCGACRYCSSPGMTSHGGRRWRGRPIPHVVEEIAHLHQRHRTRSFNFIDEDFLGPNNLAIGRAEAFASEIRQRGLRLAFSIQVRPDSLSESVISTLANAGLTYTFMGIESDDPQDLRRWGRPFRTDPWPLVNLLRKHGVEVNIGVMMWHPHATHASIRRCAERLRQYGLLEYRSAINRLDAMPGSSMHAEALAAGAIDAVRCGPQPLPFLQRRIEGLHRDVQEALAPLGPPSMHALCALPPTVARRRLAGEAGDTLIGLREIIRRQDSAVVDTFFTVLTSHETGATPQGVVDSCRRRNLTIALETSANLVQLGLAPSMEALREAIRIDAGM